jgi:hypothetical protein
MVRLEKMPAFHYHRATACYLFATDQSNTNMTVMKTLIRYAFLLTLFLPSLASAQSSASKPPEPAFPYSPSLDVTSMDKSADPCVDF